MSIFPVESVTSFNFYQLSFIPKMCFAKGWPTVAIRTQRATIRPRTSTLPYCISESAKTLPSITYIVFHPLHEVAILAEKGFARKQEGAAVGPRREGKQEMVSKRKYDEREDLKEVEYYYLDGGDKTVAAWGAEITYLCTYHNLRF